MIKTTARTLGMTVLAGSMVLGMGACTKVESKASDATSKATDAATSATDKATEQTQSPSSDTSSPSSDTTSSSSSDTSTSSDDTAMDSGDTSGPKTGKVGQEVKTAQMSAKVNKITDPITPDNDFEKAGNGKHFVAVNITMTNVGSEDLSAGDTCMKVKLDDNTSADDTYVSYGQRLEYGTLYKGDTTTGDVVYKVPNGKKIKTIDVKCSYGDEQAIRISAN